MFEILVSIILLALTISGALFVVFLILLLIAMLKDDKNLAKKRAIRLGASAAVVLLLLFIFGSSPEMLEKAGYVYDEKEETYRLAEDIDERREIKREREEKKKERERLKEENKRNRSKRSPYAMWLDEVLPFITEGQAELSQKSYNFISDNPDLFPARDNGIKKAKREADKNLDYRLLNKNPEPYFDKLVTYKGYVIDVEEEVHSPDDIVSYVHLQDDNFNQFLVVLNKTTGDILDEDFIQFWGVPVGAYSFENVSGGYTNSQVFYGSHIELIE